MGGDWRVSANGSGQIPVACAEDDLWHQVFVRMLDQRDKIEQQAANELRLQEEWTFHRLFCGQRKVDRSWLEHLLSPTAKNGTTNTPARYLGMRTKAWKIITLFGVAHNR